MSEVAKVMVALHDLAQVHEALLFLAKHKVIHPDSVVKGCKKFVKDHPEIQAHLDKHLGKETSPISEG